MPFPDLISWGWRLPSIGLSPAGEFFDDKHRRTHFTGSDGILCTVYVLSHKNTDNIFWYNGNFRTVINGELIFGDKLVEEEDHVLEFVNIIPEKEEDI